MYAHRRSIRAEAHRALIHGLLRAVVCGLIIFTALQVGAASTFTVTPQSLQWALRNFGSNGKQRLLDWQQFMRQVDRDELTYVEQVNTYFNHFVFISDTKHWGQSDYWATPTEFVASGAGDCEDFAIAKYFSLIRLGIADDKLALNYVFASRLNQSHLVLAYYPIPGSEPWVLDNLIDVIKPASMRTDLVPIYSFNASVLWKSKEMGTGTKIGHSRRIRPWRELLQRMEQD